MVGQTPGDGRRRQEQRRRPPAAGQSAHGHGGTPGGAAGGRHGRGTPGGAAGERPSRGPGHPKRSSHGFGPFGRARRGTIRAAVLAALAEGPMHGYEVMQRIQEMSGGAWRPSPGSVYPTLQELENAELVRGEQVEGRRVYALTEPGIAEARKSRDAEGGLSWITAQGAAAGRMELRQALDALGAATRQVATSGSDETVAKTLEILADARRHIYGLLAEG
ncbi:MAG TPA: PadR family transcriptional regulator [Thermoleophilia bacterium]|nr:PadR family transcriptional regulator [Thermoleophilia bacterium]